MKIVAPLIAYPPHSMVGAWLSTHECLAHMVRRGHEVQVVTMMGRQAPYAYEGVEVRTLAATLPETYTEADVIVAHLGDNQNAAMAALRMRKPLVRMVHGLESAALARLVRYGDPRLAIFPSEATREAVGYAGESLVIHPPLDPTAYRVDPGGTEITLVNLSANKGGKLFWMLADRLPHLPFLGVMGGYDDQIVSVARNVAILRHLSDMKRVYRRTRILLMPSITETWGRVGVEAAASGIPIIAHPSPGLQEALGDAATWVDRDDVDGWVDAIRSLAFPRAREAAESRSRARAAELDPLSELERFAEALEAL